MERPLSLVLAEMELAGIKVDIDCLESMQSKFKERLAEIEQVIYQEAGKEFNINSPKQLGTVLFEDLGLPYAKKTTREEYRKKAASSEKQPHKVEKKEKETTVKPVLMNDLIRQVKQRLAQVDSTR